ncbi:nicotinate (nicotinamide) nucleotide adenylyltransferase [soil metagenome]
MASASFPILTPMRIGILGGTFDPPHLAHLHAGEVAYRQLGLERVVFMPAGAPWQKIGRMVSSPLHRWEMSRLAVAGVDYFVADEREVHRDGWTFTADTLATFSPDDEIVLVLGSDAALNLPTWHRVVEVLERAEVAVAPRPGAKRRDVEGAVGEDVTWLDMASLDLSGTLIRSRVSAGQSARFLVRDAVWRYFTTHDLYGSPAA